jgi:hypothetical protein
VPRELTGRKESDEGKIPLPETGRAAPSISMVRTRPSTEALDSAMLDRTPLDRSAARDVNVNGTGKISVDFKNMPKGVRGDAEGEGLFKKTEVARQTAMEPAKDGPNVGEE